jgi:hypothetical protein
MMDKEDIINELRNLAEDKKSEMSVNVYNYLWQLIELIEKDETEQS